MYKAIFQKSSDSPKDQSLELQSSRASELRIILLLSISYLDRCSNYHLGSFNIPIPKILQVIRSRYHFNNTNCKGNNHGS